MTDLGKWLKTINVSGENIMNDAVDEKEYERMSFLINRTLSYFPDTILHANEVNQMSNVASGRMQYGYLLNSIRKKSRFSKWHKKVNDEYIPIVTEYYKCSVAKANEIIGILTKEQLDDIKQRLMKGGKVNKDGKPI